METATRILFVGTTMALGLASCTKQDSADSTEAVSPEQAVEACEAELELEGQTIPPGATVRAVLHLSLPPGWHTYADPPGDSGMPPSLRLRTESGKDLDIGDFVFPSPKRFKDSAGVTYGYEDTVELPFEFTAPETPEKNSLALKGTVHWLICRNICLPVKSTVEGRLDIETPSDRTENTGAESAN
ncbi:MAG: protein-disulfide reductase DsbD domain-containing protein [Verrucomicrobiota bacterium]